MRKSKVHIEFSTSTILGINREMYTQQMRSQALTIFQSCLILVPVSTSLNIHKGRKLLSNYEYLGEHGQTRNPSLTPPQVLCDFQKITISKLFPSQL